MWTQIDEVNNGSKTTVKGIQKVLAALLLIVAINALGGGYYGMAGAKNVPVEWLEGSPFKSYFIPALFLFVFIGIISLAAAIVVFMNKPYSPLLSYTTGTILLLWIIIQVSIIGFVSWLQPAMFLMGVAILVLTYYSKR